MLTVYCSCAYYLFAVTVHTHIFLPTGSPITPGSFIDPAEISETSSDQQVASKKSESRDESKDESKDESRDLSPEPPGAVAVLPGKEWIITYTIFM